MLTTIFSSTGTVLSAIALIYVIRRFSNLAESLRTAYKQLADAQITAESFGNTAQKLASANVTLESNLIVETDARKAAERQRDQLLAEAIKYETTKGIATRINNEIKSLAGRSAHRPD